MNDRDKTQRNNPATTDIPPLRWGPRGLFGRLPLPVVLPSTAAGAAAGTATTAFGGPLWATLGTGLGITMLSAARTRGTNIWRILGIDVALRWRNWRGPVIEPRPEPFDITVAGSGGSPCGMRWDNGHLITMLRVDRTDMTPSLLSATEIRTGAAVSLTEVARCLAQFDIRLAAVDVVTLGARTRGPDEVVRYYERLLGPLPAVATRTVWLVLRFDPLDNADAIANRGGGREGVIRTALVATQRVTTRLSAKGVRISVLTAAELAAAEAELLHDTDPREWTERRRALRCGDLELAGYAVPPEKLDSGALAAVWTVAGTATMTRFRLTPAREPDLSGRHTDEVALTALVRHDTTADRRRDTDRSTDELGLRALNGRQRRVLLDGGQLPAADAACGSPSALARFTVPAGGCGQVIGATDDGFGVAIPLFGPTVRQVKILTSLRLAQSTILRSIAVGARVIVHSTRPHEWEHMVRVVDAPEILSLSSQGGDAQHTAAATMIVYDGVSSAGHVAEGTVVHIRSATDASVTDSPVTDSPATDSPATDFPATDSPAHDADVVLWESPDNPAELRVRTASGELTIAAVSIPEESRYLVAAEPVAETAGAPAAESVGEPATESALQPA
ncbi:type VII secretion protein EccE [Nocardia sp. NPDC005366]|uniref:type VII secretion protein EccE n=1 Tax=Nocardia sp. NPDC005366 TaxID=3156878 RepID=UPI0033B1D360